MTKKAIQNNRPFRLALPKKGRLKEDFTAILETAGLDLTRDNTRLDYGRTRDEQSEIESFETLLQRPGDALENLACGVAEMAVIGLDNFEEASCRAQEEGTPFDIRVVAAFNDISACGLYIAVPDAMQISKPQDLAGMRIATSYPTILKRWLKNEGVDNVTVISRDGGIEDYVRLGMADAVCDVVESGKTLIANGLKRTDIKLLDSSAVLVQRRGTMPDSYARQASQIAQRLKSAAQTSGQGDNEPLVKKDAPASQPALNAP